MPKTKMKKAVAKNYLVFTSSCGKTSQATFYGDAATLTAAQTMAEKAMKDDSGYDGLPKAVYVTKIEKTGTMSSDVFWA